MKKRFLQVLSMVMVIMMSLVGCSGNKKVTQSFDVGISQLADHPALDAARQGFEDGLKELGMNVNIIYQNAQGDIPTSLSIAEKFVKDKVDLIYAIATPAAQTAKQATKDIPIIFSAVTDPVEAELVETMENPGGNITGTSDLTPMDRQLKIFKDLDNSIKKVGIIFNTSEPNSQVQVEMAKDIAPTLGLEIVEIGISNINDIPQAIDSITKKVDGIYTITDNMVASAISIVAEKAIANKMITVGAEDSHVKGGILITDGISYYELGKQSAHMAKAILADGKSPADIPSATSENTEKAFNEGTLKALELKVDNPVFKDAIKVE
ncbi:MAG: ABC transporter substrate-binding protein [Clostridiales bacterium]|nr:ABC transporter substrate-binding protein [Clostridiales bacterium]